jgi:thiosulfate dehydrogenase (quinone) large subunit
MTKPTSGRGGWPNENDEPPAPPAGEQRAEEAQPDAPPLERGHRPRQDWLASDTGTWSGWLSTNPPVPASSVDSETGGGTEAAEEAPRPRPAWDSPSRLDLPGVSPITRGERRRAQQRAAAASAGWPEDDGYPSTVGHAVWALARITLGFLFLWTFLDALVGLNRPTPAGFGWLDGVSPTTDYLSGVHNSLRAPYRALAGQAWVDWLFMIALVLVGLALLLGAGVTLAATAGSALMILLWLASLPLTGAPVVDHHIVYALVLIGIAATGAGLRFSLAPWWRRTRLVRKLPILR